MNLHAHKIFKTIFWRRILVVKHFTYTKVCLKKYFDFFGAHILSGNLWAGPMIYANLVFDIGSSQNPYTPTSSRTFFSKHVVLAQTVDTSKCLSVGKHILRLKDHGLVQFFLSSQSPNDFQERQ